MHACGRSWRRYAPSARRSDPSRLGCVVVHDAQAVWFKQVWRVHDHHQSCEARRAACGDLRWREFRQDGVIRRLAMREGRVVS